MAAFLLFEFWLTSHNVYYVKFNILYLKLDISQKKLVSSLRNYRFVILITCRNSVFVEIVSQCIFKVQLIIK